jgi:hypothetical protein
MVIYEVLSGRAPFTYFKTFIVVWKVTEGERPERPRGVEGAWFMDDLWAMLELCWVPQPEGRPSIEAVLGCLERVSRVSRPSPPQIDDDVTMDEDD